MLPRPLSSAESTAYTHNFQYFNPPASQVTAERSGAYNCVAWSVGIFNDNPWPGDTQADFDRYYAALGYHPATSGPIAVWRYVIALPTGSKPGAFIMRHACRISPAIAGKWESKFGDDLRITHDLPDVRGTRGYGEVAGYYQPGPNFEAESFRARQQREQLAQTWNQALGVAPPAFVAQVDETRRAEFQVAFAAWKRTWTDFALAISSRPADRAVGPQYDALVQMGPPILPLVVEAMQQRENVFALQLYDALAGQQHHAVELVVKFTPEDVARYGGEWARSRLATQRWIAQQQ